MNAIAYRWTREGNLVIPDPVKLERKLPLYFRHQHYSSFQRQLNNFGFNKQHKSASPLNSVYVRIKGEQLADVDVVELLHLRPVLERSTLRRAKRARRAAPAPKAATPAKRRRAAPVTPPGRGPAARPAFPDRAPGASPVTPPRRRPVPVDLGRAAPAAYGRLPHGFTFRGAEPATPTTVKSPLSGGLDGVGDKPSLAVTFSRKNDPIGAPHFEPCLEPPPPGAGPRTSRPASPVDDDLLLSPPPPLFAEDWGARCSSPELWAHVGDLVEEPDVTYAGGFPEDYSDVFGAPAAALPAF